MRPLPRPGERPKLRSDAFEVRAGNRDFHKRKTFPSPRESLVHQWGTYLGFPFPVSPVGKPTGSAAGSATGAPFGFPVGGFPMGFPTGFPMGSPLGFPMLPVTFRNGRKTIGKMVYFRSIPARDGFRVRRGSGRLPLVGHAKVDTHACRWKGHACRQEDHACGRHQ